MKATVKKAELTGPGSYWNRSPHAISAIRAIRQTKQTRNKLTTKKHTHTNKQRNKQDWLACVLGGLLGLLGGLLGMEVCCWRLRTFIGWPLYWKLAIGCSLAARLANWLSGWSAHQTTPCALRSIATWNLKAMRAKKQQIWAMWELQSYFQTQTQTQMRTQKDRHREGIANQRASHVQSAQTSKQTNTQNSIALNQRYPRLRKWKSYARWVPRWALGRQRRWRSGSAEGKRANAKAQMQRDI